MTILWAGQALLEDGWAERVRIEIDAAGRTASIRAGAEPEGDRRAILLPAPANLHSHAFQRAMAGLTERRGPDPRDSFWTWRQLMFRFLDRLTPEDVEAVAAFVQMEMLEAGYACNVEFHYLHHRPGGLPYENLAEMSARIAAAAETSGIGLTLLPVLYQFGGCDRRPLGPGQIRFGNDPERFARLFEGAGAALRGLPADTRLGVAPHSLRAVGPEGLRAATALGEGPIHMHLAEQLAEVEEVEAVRGARPVRWLLAHAAVDARWCLIHCTQMEPDETLALAATGAVAGLCPITESSLGDGIFDGVRWTGADGRFGIGSDSNIRIALSEELRTLEYSQRLRDRSRAALATPDASTGRVLFEGAARGGAQAAGRGRGVIAEGEWADLLALDGEAVDLAGRRGDVALDSWIFAGDDRMVTDVWSAGRHLVTGGRHVAREAITRRYAETLRGLRDAL
ncbi:formimidoylglutamate deiminase [Paracoccus sp. S-4012]|uniref:formimidoylglutamate deiminase n=1 Tax=Paracoccus sp. S-4012 TaxID=2665648 RepID=UPI0012B0ECD5|nr:formimidoylglutamate deiminase [Paracoccus sp. S-4012]MRX51945.1 formimidoylglutamate deiminase [Paracoccus sp. S-4012]